MTEKTMGYGFSDDSVSRKNFQFGLNENVRLTKFEYNPNGGKDGAEQDCIDIEFTFEGNDKYSFRQFPIDTVYADGEPISAAENPHHPDVIKAFANFSAMMVHILGCFLDKEDLRAALAREFKGFVDYAKTLQKLLPNGFENKKLDVFMQWEWQPRQGQERTYLQLPKKMSYGRWCVPHVNASDSWSPVEKPNPTSADKIALYYEDGEGNRHPFTKNGWFMSSPFAAQQSNETASEGLLSKAVGAEAAGSDWDVD